MPYPEIIINQSKLIHNASVICQQAAKYNIKIAGVTKACLGHESVARAMIAGGVNELADSRIENLRKLADLNLGVPLMLLRMPGLSRVEETVRWADTSLNSEYEVMIALSTTARKLKKTHNVVIMVDLGDLREGVLPKDVLPLAREVLSMRGLKLRGLGVNLSCYGGICPSLEILHILVELAKEVQTLNDRELDIVSGGNSSSLRLLFEGQIPTGVTHLRIGEGILLGRETVHRQPLEKCYQDAFMLKAEVVEAHVKPSLPTGNCGQNAFGESPEFQDSGPMVRVIVGLGRQDVPLDGIYPLDQRLQLVGSSSDHLIIDAGKKPGIKVGDIVSFGLNYSGLLGAMTSPFVSKKVI